MMTELGHWVAKSGPLYQLDMGASGGRVSVDLPRAEL